MDVKTAIKLMKDIRRELMDYHGVNNPIAEALYVLITIAEEYDKMEGKNEQK